MLKAAVLSEKDVFQIAELRATLRRPAIECLGRVNVWLWDEETPLPPMTLGEHVRYSFSYLKESWLDPTHELYHSEKAGLAKLGISSKSKNGLDIVDDLSSLCMEAYDRYFAETSIGKLAITAVYRRNRYVEHQDWIYTAIDMDWEVTP